MSDDAQVETRSRAALHALLLSAETMVDLLGLSSESTKLLMAALNLAREAISPSPVKDEPDPAFPAAEEITPVVLAPGMGATALRELFEAVEDDGTSRELSSDDVSLFRGAITSKRASTAEELMGMYSRKVISKGAHKGKLRPLYRRK